MSAPEGLYLERGEDRWITSGKVYLDADTGEWIIPVTLGREYDGGASVRLSHTWLLRFEPGSGTWRDPGPGPRARRGRPPPRESVPAWLLAHLTAWIAPYVAAWRRAA